MSENLDVFSLEEDEGNELFITQSSSDNTMMELCQDDKELDILNGFSLGVPNTDFQSPCVSLLDKSKNQPIYEDISDDEFEQKNCCNDSDRR